MKKAYLLAMHRGGKNVLFSTSFNKKKNKKKTVYCMLKMFGQRKMHVTEFL